ncbi:hypothetical protein [Achromobacter aloeverae]|uniref:Uncharacterized protein n=1 Tax=Achromobacter aloeverae TaxID=1750518 RepID=A0A4Q1HK39_9BURK|nr:hypothetical protein [Achromobacter aloeverae]RXN87996.1 hypothetical protein C7R54_15580 [Achromobacter aloeverae]
MTYEEAEQYVRSVRQAVKAECGDNLDAAWEATNKRTEEDPKFAEALRMIGFRHVLESQQTRQ